MSDESARRAGRPRGRPGRAARAAAALIAVTVAGSACTPLDDAMAAIFGRDMRVQRSITPYELNRLPAEGSVPFAIGNYPAQLDDLGLGQAASIERDVPPFTAQDMARGGLVANELQNPVPVTEETLARGALLYTRYCAVCHAASGVGSESILMEKMPYLAAYNLQTATQYTDGYLYGMIRVGRGNMPAYGHRIPHFDRWMIVNYVRQLQQGGAPAAGDAVQDTAGAAQDDAGGQAAAADTAGGEG